MKLFDLIRERLRVKHYSLSTERTYCQWILRFLRSHKDGETWRHPTDLHAPDVERFLTHLAVDGHVSASTQNQALNALLFLYREVLSRPLGDFDAVRARRPVRVPSVLSVVEIRELLGALDVMPTTEPYAVMARLMYGAGLRLMECCRLRVKDVDLARGQLTVRGGKGDKDGFVMLPKWREFDGKLSA